MKSCNDGQDELPNYENEITSTPFHEEFFNELIFVLKSKAFWLIVVMTLVIALITTFLVWLKKNKKAKEIKGRESVINPMYGQSQAQDYGYYMETRIEETNPHYDAYYKEETTNITDDNEDYGKETK